MANYLKPSYLWTILWKDESRRKTVLLLFANFFSLFLGVCINLIVTRYLGVKDYSSYSLLISIFNFSVVLINIGCFHAVNRAVVVKKDCGIRREYYGIMVWELLIWALLLSVILAVYSCFDPVISEHGLRKLFLCLCFPGSLVFLCSKAFDTVLKADNRIYALSASHVIPRLLLLTGIVLCYFLLKTGNKLFTACSLYLGSFGVIYFIILYCIKPGFIHFKRRMLTVFHYWKHYGFNMYAGALFTVGSNRLTPVLIGYLSKEQSDVGFFSLATFFAAPLLLIPNTIATSNFERFARQKSLLWRNILWSLLISAAGMTALFIILPVFFRLFYLTEFYPAVKLCHLIAAAYLFWGMADFFERFISAHGKSKAIRNVYMSVGLTTVILNCILIPFHGASGGAIALICSSIVYLITMIVYCYYKGFMPEFKKTFIGK